MSLLARLSAHFSTLSMAVPARIALWLGLLCVIAGQQTRQPVFTVVGSALIVAGTALWLWFRPTGGGWKQLLGLKSGKTKSKPGKPAKKPTHNLEALRHAAQNDPRLQAKRKPKTPDAS